jgi:hypothetical protein
MKRLSDRPIVAGIEYATHKDVYSSGVNDGTAIGSGRAVRKETMHKAKTEAGEYARKC